MSKNILNSHQAEGLERISWSNQIKKFTKQLSNFLDSCDRSIDQFTGFIEAQEQAFSMTNRCVHLTLIRERIYSQTVLTLQKFGRGIREKQSESHPDHAFFISCIQFINEEWQSQDQELSEMVLLPIRQDISLLIIPIFNNNTSAASSGDQYEEWLMAVQQVLS